MLTPEIYAYLQSLPIPAALTDLAGEIIQEAAILTFQGTPADEAHAQAITKYQELVFTAA